MKPLAKPFLFRNLGFALIKRLCSKLFQIIHNNYDTNGSIFMYFFLLFFGLRKKDPKSARFHGVNLLHTNTMTLTVSES